MQNSYRIQVNNNSLTILFLDKIFYTFVWMVENSPLQLVCFDIFLYVVGSNFLNACNYSDSYNGSAIFG